MRIWSLYVPNGRKPGDPHYLYKLEWLAALRTAAGSMTGDVALVGDWNVAPQDDDVFDIARFANSTHVTPPERAAFSAFIEDGFVDVVRPHTPGPDVYTYWDYYRQRYDETGDVEDELALVVGGRQVDGRDDPPVVVALGVAEDLLDLPGPAVLLDQEHLRPAGVRAGVDGVVLVEVRLQRLAPVLAPMLDPFSASSSPSCSQRRSAASSTRRNIALRTSTVKARSLAVIAPGAGGSTSGAASRAVGSLSCSHSSSRLESVWRTTAPSHSMMSSSSSVRTLSGTVWRSAR